jgi:RNA polymerase sigma-70 factor (ECF subfamily)
MEPDHILLEKFIHGEEAAFHELVIRHQKPLYRFVYRMIRDAEETADLCQLVFVQVFLKATQFEGRSQFRTWLYQIALNQSRNRLREKRWETVDIEDVSLPTGGSVLDKILSEEEIRLLRSAISSLPEKQRVTVLLRIDQELTFEEIAEVLGSPIGTVKANFHHGVTGLKKLLRERE